MTTLSPARIVWPPSSMSRVAVRRKWITGVAQRTISSTAVGATAREVGHPRRGAASGKSVSAFMPWLMALRVVSLPATTSRMKNEPNSGGRQALAVDLGVHQRRGDVVARASPCAPRPSACAYCDSSMAAAIKTSIVVRVLGIADAEDDVR